MQTVSLSCQLLKTLLVLVRIGRVEQIGTPQEVYKNPVNKFVAGFIGSPAMNFINVKLIGDHIVGDAFNLKVPEGALKVLRDKGYERVKN